MKKIIDKNNGEFLKKALAGILAGSFATLLLAGRRKGGIFCPNGRYALSSGPAEIIDWPGIRVHERRFKVSLIVAAICKI